MKYNKIFRILVLTVIFSLLVIAIPATPVLAATLFLTPTSGPPGTPVTVTGSGYLPGHNIAISFDGIDVAWPVPTATATITASFTVPTDKAAGSYLVRAIDYTTSLQVASVSFTVTGTAVGEAEIDLDPDEGAVGTEVEIEGDDFSAEEDIEAF